MDSLLNPPGPPFSKGGILLILVVISGAQERSMKFKNDTYFGIKSPLSAFSAYCARIYSGAVCTARLTDRIDAKNSDTAYPDFVLFTLPS